MLLLFSWTIILSFISFQYLREKQFKSEFLSVQLQQYNKYLLEIIDNGLSYEDYIASHEKPFKELRISIITLSGAVIYDNALPIESLDNHKKRPEVVNALKHGFGYHIGRQSHSDGKEYFYSATKGERVIVRTAIPYSANLREMLKADWTFLGIMASISLIMSVFAYFATRRLGRNIEQLNVFAEKARKGESLEGFDMFPNDELGSISNHIVRLYSKWQQTIQDRDMAHELAIREEQEKIRIKRQLTNNINHELKTPVASMQVCLETLLSDIPLSEEKRQELIERCYVNNVRLRRLLEDISLITRLEDGRQIISKEEVVINDVLDEIIEEVEMMSEEERMDLHVDFNEKIVVSGNHSLISSIFRNLIENSFAYSGGDNIYITLLKNDENECLIRFEDDGCGVEDKQLTRLFERFYRVDKGRSRKKGGTGLGLAIVKHAVLFHGGAISACNRLEGGLQFDFSLKATSINCDF